MENTEGFASNMLVNNASADDARYFDNIETHFKYVESADKLILQRGGLDFVAKLASEERNALLFLAEWAIDELSRIPDKLEAIYYAETKNHILSAIENIKSRIFVVRNGMTDRRSEWLTAKERGDFKEVF